MTAFVIQDYLMILIYLATEVFTVINICVFIVRQKRYRNLSLLLYYILSFFLIAIDLVYWIIYYQSFVGYNLVLQFLPGILKIDIGLIQAWIMIELAIEMHYIIKSFETESQV